VLSWGTGSAGAARPLEAARAVVACVRGRSPSIRAGAAPLSAAGVEGVGDPGASARTVDLAPPTQRPQLRDADRLLLTAPSRALPRHAWAVFSVSPRTLLRWYSSARLYRRRRSEHARPGGRSCVSRPQARSPATSSRSRPPSCSGSTSCSSSRWRHGGSSTSPAPQGRIEAGSHSRRATSSCSSAMTSPSGCWCMIATRSSATGSTTSSAPRASR
jgi:hypothetical protein